MSDSLDEHTTKAQQLVAQALLPPDAREYWEKLGQFIATFSSVELLLASTVWKIARLKSPTAEATLPSVRIHDGIATLNRLCDAQKWSPKRRKIWKDASQQLGEINGLRNDILHYGATIKRADEIEVSNRSIAHIPERIRTVTISVSTLQRVRDDLTKIMAALIVTASPAHLIRYRIIFEAVLAEP